MYIRVAVNIPGVSGVFDYHLPAELIGQVTTGCLVIVPFGKQTAQGIVLRQISEPQVLETRPVKALLDPYPVLTSEQIGLAKWLSERTLSPLVICLSLMLPPGLSKQADTLYSLNKTPPKDDRKLTSLQQRLIDLLHQHGDMRGRQLSAAIPHQNWKRSARVLVRRGWLLTRPVLLPPSVRSKVVRTIQLACPPEMAESYMGDLGKGAALQRRQRILRFLMKEPWPVDISRVYAASGGNRQDLNRLSEKGLVTLGETEVWRDPLEKIEYTPMEIPQLTREQTAVWEQVQAGLQCASRGERTQPYLLHGVTGSGKTEIYLQAVAETLRLGRQAIIMVPEIALTPQTLRRFVARFPGQVGLIHSRLSPGERYDTWRRARAGLLPIIIGPRSALFTPMPDLGLIVIDECHDDSYYQSEGQPHYHAVSTAIAYAKNISCVLILGSATPDISLTYQSRSESWNLLSLPFRILAHRQAVESQLNKLGLNVPDLPGDGVTAHLPLPPVKVVDMRQELKAGNRSIFSRALQLALTEVLNAGQQAILFLNRRGSATYVFCRNCGYVSRCPRCDLPLTLHIHRAAAAYDANVLLCHTCGYRRKLPKKCPQCTSSQIRYYGTGTEKVEQVMQALFPNAVTLRWDAGTTRRKGTHELLLSRFANHHADILIGTQMLAKGLDLPLVTLVGVILADVGLTFPDFRSGERTFQLLTQVAGRAGRSPLGGQVILQTFQPDHYAIQAASNHDFDGFYKQELEYRRSMGYPPFSHLVRLEFRHFQAKQAEDTALNMASKVQHWIQKGNHTATEIIGPVPCFFSRVKGYYRWQIILRGPNPIDVLRDRPLGEWRVEVDPPSIL